MDLVKAWGAALVGGFLSLMLYMFVAVSAGDPEQISSGATHYLWSLIPTVIIFLLTTLLAAIFHGTGHSTGRHLLAVFAVPVIGLLISAVGSILYGTTAGDAVLSIVAAVIGMLVGWQLVDRFRKEKAKSTGDSYW